MAILPMENVLSTLSVNYEGDAPTPSFSEWIHWGDDPDPGMDDQQISDIQSFMNAQSETTTDGIPVGQDLIGWKHRACSPWIMPADDKSLEAGEQDWKWAESVDGDSNYIGYWTAASGEPTASDEYGELRLHPILIMMPQPVPARRSYNSILHGKWGYQDMGGKVVVLRQEEVQALEYGVGGGTLLQPSQLKSMRYRKRSEQGPICIRPAKRVRTIISDVEHLQTLSNIVQSTASSTHNLPRYAENEDIGQSRKLPQCLHPTLASIIHHDHNPSATNVSWSACSTTSYWFSHTAITYTSSTSNQVHLEGVSHSEDSLRSNAR